MILPNQKTSASPSPGLENTKVDVWRALLEQPREVVQKLESILSGQERRRLERFRFREQRQSFIVSRGILRNLLYRYTGIQPHQIEFKYNMAGKPNLAGARAVPELHFNLSHTGPLVLYSFSRGRRVGIDIERIRPMEEMDRVAEMCFSPAEYERFRRVREQDRLRAFYNCWTRKEAFIKAIGEGMTFPLRAVEVAFEPGIPVKLLSINGSVENANQWTMHDLEGWDGYAGALVVEGTGHSISPKQWTYLQDLL